jgi:hypothetical protein
MTLFHIQVLFGIYHDISIVLSHAGCITLARKYCELAAQDKEILKDSQDEEKIVKLDRAFELGESDLQNGYIVDALENFRNSTVSIAQLFIIILEKFVVKESPESQEKISVSTGSLQSSVVVAGKNHIVHYKQSLMLKIHS